MKTKNVYILPIDKDKIKEIVTREAPGHRKYKVDNKIYDESNAIDFLCEEGTEVKATLDGKVFDVFTGVTKRYSGYDTPSENQLPREEWYGNYVVIEHENGEYLFYGHLKSILVKKGDIVKKGQVIGYSGNVGWSIKPHLHYMVFKFLESPPKKGNSYITLEVVWEEHY